MCLLKGSLLAEAPRPGTDDRDAARPTEADALAGPSGVSKPPADAGGEEEQIPPYC